MKIGNNIKEKNKNNIKKVPADQQSLNRWIKRGDSNQCDKKETNKGELKNHIKNSHEENGYPCNQCKHKSESKETLKKHIEAMHESNLDIGNQK